MGGGFLSRYLPLMRHSQLDIRSEFLKASTPSSGGESTTDPFKERAVHSMYRLYRTADEREGVDLSRTSKFVSLAEGTTGH
jgi:hypothetical protein